MPVRGPLLSAGQWQEAGPGPSVRFMENHRQLGIEAPPKFGVVFLLHMAHNDSSAVTYNIWFA
jgi:hypothetical protein